MAGWSSGLGAALWVTERLGAFRSTILVIVTPGRHRFFGNTIRILGPDVSCPSSFFPKSRRSCLRSTSPLVGYFFLYSSFFPVGAPGQPVRQTRGSITLALSPEIPKPSVQWIPHSAAGHFLSLGTANILFFSADRRTTKRGVVGLYPGIAVLGRHFFFYH